MKISAVKNHQISFKSAACQKVAHDVAELILSYRRPLLSETPSLQKQEYLISYVTQKIMPSIKKERPIPMVILGFPMKSASAKKVISAHADRGEYESLEHIKGLTQRIRDIYPAGSDFRIFSDGRIFVETIYKANDSNVSTYLKDCKKILRSQNASDVKIYSAEDFYTGSYDKVRQNLFSDFPVSREDVHKKLMQTKETRDYLTNLSVFYANDMRGADPSLTVKQAKARAKDIAEGVIQTSSSYDKMIRNIYGGDYVRLSVHPYPSINPDNKIGFFLNKDFLQEPTPWHSAPVRITSPEGKEHFIFEKKSVIESTGSELIPDKDSKGAYYQYPEHLPYDFSLSFKENFKKLVSDGKIVIQNNS